MTKTNRGKILVTLDGSDRALEAVRYISRFPTLRDKQIVLLTIISTIPEVYWDLQAQPQYSERLREIRAWQTSSQMAIEGYMERARQELVNQGFGEESVVSEIREQKSGIARDIIREAKRGYEAVVAGRKGSGRLRELVLGSVAWKLLEKVEFVPLFLIGRGPKPGKILIAVDGSDLSMKTVNVVGEMLTGWSDCKLGMVHVIRGEGKEHIEEGRNRIAPFFDDAKSRLDSLGVCPDRIVTKVITGVQSRAVAIVEEAREGGYGTIAMGRRGLSKRADFFMGRVSNKVVQLGRDLAIWIVS